MPPCCRAILALIVSSTQLGCASVLGYDDLSFGEQPDASSDSPQETGATDSSATDSSATDSSPSTDASKDVTTDSPIKDSEAEANPCASVNCGPNQYCDDPSTTCLCNPGFMETNSGCSPIDPGSPDTHSQDGMCKVWTISHTISDPSPWKGVVGLCDPGSLSQAGINDTLARINGFRWLVGLGPTSNDPTLDAIDMKCAAVSSWNPPSQNYNPHAPDPSVKCYSAEGASGASQSNIAWGSGHPAAAIDQFIEDNGNDTTFGHRRWVFNPGLGPVGIGYYAGGGAYGNAECLAVFGSSMGGPAPVWIAFPPPGFSPTILSSWTWTFHHTHDVTNATIRVVRQSDSQELPMLKLPLVSGYSSYSTVAFRRSAWTPAPNDEYEVTVDGIFNADAVSYRIKPVDCL